MKHLILSFMILSCCSFLYAEAYVVVNPDGSIHCIEEKPNEVLVNGKKRFVIDKYIPIDNQIYYWSSDGLTLRPENEVEEIKSKRKEDQRKLILQNAIKKKNEIEEVEAMDGGDWSEEKGKWQDIIDSNLKAK